jgi:ABC-type sugar transport system ATPase subunit
VEGAISVNSEPITANEMQRISGFVHQEDVIMDTMTVREALTFSAMMRLPSSMPKGEPPRLLWRLPRACSPGPVAQGGWAGPGRCRAQRALAGQAGDDACLCAARPAEEKHQRALDVAELLGLTEALDSLVGSAMIKGISGGEKRRWGAAGWLDQAGWPALGARGA